jgi:hypothetical protein
MEEFKIIIANDYSVKPGGRWKRLGPDSGEAFYDTVLLPKYESAVEAGEKLHVYLDGVRSYPYSFLDQSFGELARKKGAQEVCSNIVFHGTTFGWVDKYVKDEIWFKK